MSETTKTAEEELKTDASPVVEKKKKERKNKDTSTTAPSTLFVRGLPYDCTNEDLEAFFSEIGPIKACFAVVDTTQTNPEDPKKVKNKGYGFVHYALTEDATRAMVELKKRKFMGKRTLKMEMALKKTHDPAEKVALRSTIVETPKRIKKDAVDSAIPEEETSNPPADAEGTCKTKSAINPFVTLLITGLPADVTKKQIYKRVRKNNTVKEVVHPAPAGADGSGDLDDSIAHIVYNTPDDALSAVKHLDKHVFKGAKLNVATIADARREFLKARLIVRNLPWKYRENDLSKIFSEHGKVMSVSLPRKFPNGPLRGFAFVQMDSIESATTALNALNATEHHGRPIAVDWSLSKGQYAEAEKSENVEEKGDQSEKNKKSEDQGEIDEDLAASEEGAGETDDQADGDDDDEECAEDDADEEDDEDEDEEDGEDEDEDQEDNDEEDDEKDDEAHAEMEDEVSIQAQPTEETLKRVLPTADDGTTLFVRNLSFDSTEEELKEKFNDFGPVRYARIVKFPTSGRSRGVGFVCFREAKTAQECLQSYEALSAQPGCDSGDAARSVLVPEFAADAASKFALDGRLLSITLAVNKNTAKEFEENSAKRREKEDKRNVYLMTEGVIFPNSPAAVDLTPNEISKRQASYTSRKALIAKNPLLFISKTRLSVRNLPVKIDDKDLRKLALDSVRLFKEEVKAGKREGLTDEEKHEGWDEKPKVVQAKIVRDQERIDVETGKPKSKGYGFLEFARHSHALASLRYMNNNPDVFKHITFTQVTEKSNGEGQNAQEVQKGMPSKRRMIVEFSVENISVVKKRQERLSTQRKRHGNEEGGKGNPRKRKIDNEKGDVSKQRPSGRQDKKRKGAESNKSERQPKQDNKTRGAQSNKSERKPKQDNNKTSTSEKPATRKPQVVKERAENAKRVNATKPAVGKRKRGEKTDKVEDLVKKHKMMLTGGDNGSGKTTRWFE